MAKSEEEKKKNKEYMVVYNKMHPYSEKERTYSLDFPMTDKSDTKVCSRCKEELPVSEYYIMRPKRSKPYRQSHCKRCLKNNSFTYHKENRKKINTQGRERILARHHVRYSSDPEFKMSMCLRARVRSALKKKRYQKKKLRTNELIGCTYDFLKGYLESKFSRGMTWENYGSYWHIDHVVPCDSFDLLDVYQQRLCFHYSNMQPLPKKENLKKSNHVDSVVQLQFPLVHTA